VRPTRQRYSRNQLYYATSPCRRGPLHISFPWLLWCPILTWERNMLALQWIKRLIAISFSIIVGSPIELRMNITRLWIKYVFSHHNV
jgi:hypothetical protein